VPASSYPEEPEEASKVKVALALSGKPLVHFDNIEDGGTYGNSGIDGALTQSVIDERILGISRMTGPIALRASWFLSGNNLAPSKAAYRRWLPSNIVTEEEHPEERQGLKIKDLRGYLLEHRGGFVRDALTILRAHAQAGRPIGDWGPLASYEAWDPIVRGAVWYATGLDCCKTLREAAEESPERLDNLALLTAWRGIPGGAQGEGGVTGAEALEHAKDSSPLYEPLRTALLAFGSRGELPSPRTLGNKLRALRGNNIGGLKFVRVGTGNQGVRWRVDKRA
jgi:hypothetical protein